jgi:hypothetical protein
MLTVRQIEAFARQLKNAYESVRDREPSPATEKAFIALHAARIELLRAAHALAELPAVTNPIEPCLYCGGTRSPFEVVEP